MSLGEAVATCFRKYASFKGRARLSEFWWWVLFVVILIGGIAVGAGVTGAVDELGSLDPNSGAAALLAITWLGLFLPNLAVAVRRLHDTGRSGWFILLGLIPASAGSSSWSSTRQPGTRDQIGLGQSPGCSTSNALDRVRDDVDRGMVDKATGSTTPIS